MDHCRYISQLKQDKEYQKYSFIVALFILVVLLALLLLIIYMVGCYKVFDRMFYCMTFHWVLKLVIQFKNGESMNEGLDQNLKEIVENDEEMANAIIDTENDVNEEEEK